MSLSPVELAEVVAELSAGLSGAAVQKVWAYTPQRLCLQLRCAGRNVFLWICTEANLSRLSVEDSGSRPAPPEASSLQRFLRQELVGARWAGITQPSARRVEATFVRGESSRRLVAELGANARIRIVREAESDSSEESAAAPRPDGARPSRLASRATPGAFPLARAAEALFASVDGGEAEATLRKVLRAPLLATLRRLERTLAKVNVEADRGGVAEEHRRLGEILRLHGDLSRGVREVTLTEYTAAGARPVQVTLDPTLSARQQVERHFHLYRRLKRGTERAKERRRELAEERDQVRASLERLEAMDLPALRAAGKGAAQKRRGRKDAVPVRRVFRKYTGAGGTPIWVGRGGADNDALTFQVARPEHWWLHARGVPGAHVVVPLGRDRELSPEVLVDAAHLALHHSDLKGAAQGEVSYTRVKFVRKAKGGGPGQVTYTREKTFFLRVVPAQLARLLRGKDAPGDDGGSSDE